MALARRCYTEAATRESAMVSTPVLVDLDAANLESLPCCGVTNEAHPGRCDKNKWL